MQRKFACLVYYVEIWVMDYGKLHHTTVDDSILMVIALLQKARCRESTALTDPEIIEEGLWLLLSAKDQIEHLVKNIDPDRFGPIRTTALTYQDLNRNRLNTCRYCGHTRCTSDHK